MRRAFRAPVRLAPSERLARAIAVLPPAARSALTEVADRDDLGLVSGSWSSETGGCLVANVLAASVGADSSADARTLDLRILEHFPELSSRDLNRLIVAWDEAAAEAGAEDDRSLRRLLREGLALAADRVPIGS